MEGAVFRAERTVQTAGGVALPVHLGPACCKGAWSIRLGEDLQMFVQLMQLVHR